jgi:hypothetical protein
MIDTLFWYVGIPLTILLYIIGQSIIIVALHSEKLKQYFPISYYSAPDAILLSILLFLASFSFPLLIIFSPIIVPIALSLYFAIKGIDTLAKKVAHIIDNTEIRKKDEN